MGRHHYAAEATEPTEPTEPTEATEASGPEDWEEPPATAPLWRVRIVTSAVLLLAVVAGTWWAVGWLTSPAGPTGSGAPVAASVAPAAPGEERVPEPDTPVPDAGPTRNTETVTVHVAGEVADPGLVELPAGARVQDALQAAGGPTGDAVVELLNLAAPAVDGSQILVPGPDSANSAANGEGGAVADTPASAGGVSGPGGVNINTADSSALEGLPGIGPALAGRIIDHREQVGPFSSVEDLDAVSGIGPAMMERLDGLVSW